MYNASCRYVYTGCLQFLNSSHEQFINPMPKHFTTEEIIIKVGVYGWQKTTFVWFKVQFCKKLCFSVRFKFNKNNCDFNFFWFDAIFYLRLCI